MKASRTGLYGLAVGVSLAAAAGGQTRPAASASAPPPASLLDTLHRSELAEIARNVADRPLLPPAAAAADVARVDVFHDRLRVTTRRPATDRPSRIVVGDLAGGLCTLTVIGLPHAPAAGPDGAAVVPGGLLFDHFTATGVGVADADTTVAVYPTTFQLSRVVERPDGSSVQTQLTEQRFPPSPIDGPPPLSLRVTDTGGFGRRPAPAVTRAAASFGHLCRTDPSAVARHVEPMLRDVGADATALPPDVPLAYQVFAADVAVPSAVAERVGRLVPQLDADDFRDRDAAGDALRALGPTVAVALGRSAVAGDPAKLSPEQRARVAGVVRSFRPVTDAEADALRGNVDFLLNCLKVEADPFVTRVALRRLAAAVGHPVPFDDRLRGRPRLEAIWSLRQQLTAGDGPASRPAG